MQLFDAAEAAEGNYAVAAFQRLRWLVMRINPQDEDKRTRNLSFTAESWSSLKKCEVLRALPTDTSLGE